MSATSQIPLKILVNDGARTGATAGPGLCRRSGGAA